MAYAILTNGNGRRSGDYMTTNYNSNLNFTRFQNIQNPNPNPNPNFSHFFAGRFQTHPYSAPAFIRYPINSIPSSSGYRYITFRLSSYTRTELRELKNRLISDLERVRFLRQRLCYRPPLGKAVQKAAVGRKRTNPVPPVRGAKKQCGRVTQAQRRKTMMRECGQILGKLMQHKHGWVFNTPVDAVGLKLLDYHNTIKKPMDLGTIKSKLGKNEYGSALSFASDVRLTFQNAMVYNGKGSNVYIMAERLLLLFENMWDSSSQKDAIQVKKREMTAAEKAELAARLTSLKLGREGMNEMMEIVKKGVIGEGLQGAEVELDIAVLDNDTLWGLHGFVMRNSEVDIVVEEDEDEDVDIGEEMESSVFTPIVIEKDGSSSESSSETESSSGDSGPTE